MNKPMHIEIISDVSCPWCIIGYKSLSLALNRLSPQINAHIAWKPFELNPGMPAEGQHLGEHLHEKYGSSQADIEQTRSMITARGAALGFPFNFKDDGRIYNTFNAHRLLYWARQFDRQTELKLALFGLYFTEGGNPGNVDELLQAATKAGLPPDEARKILESERFGAEVRAEEAKYQAMGINMVPTFIINEKYRITGGMPVDEFVAKLEQLVAGEITGEAGTK
ncbi:MAG: disulfide bond formation protein DsbA [Gallionellales bacterium 35-53-114]|nr:MAG: disulfide bond formation protein DsbA [Gallionellales bacterium 35-53-114]OYZ63518.1 MAG: disulfide bond formation protein DsbA [Gallionellales bacterium 24-53-125]OZB10872.1 MAG: disulfide bond formation protein DsbA [Gallionellales bacterium 39-52-133]